MHVFFVLKRVGYSAAEEIYKGEMSVSFYEPSRYMLIKCKYVYSFNV